MALRWNHYDLAFEAFLRERRNPYVAVDERRRARTLDERIEQLSTAQEDADDTAYWMEVISGAHLMRRDLLTPLLEEATDLSATIAESRESARRRRARRPKAAR